MSAYENDCNGYNKEMFRLMSNYERTKKVDSMLDNTKTTRQNYDILPDSFISFEVL